MSAQEKCQHCGALATTNGIMGQPRCCDACDNLPMSCDCAKRAKTDTCEERIAPVRIGDKFRSKAGNVLEVVAVGYGADRVVRIEYADGRVGTPTLKVSVLRQMERVS